MATREENIKKIESEVHAELELLTDEELDQISGGTYAECCEIDRIMEKDPAGKKYNMHIDIESNVVAYLRNELGIEAKMNGSFIDSILPWKTDQPAIYTEIKTGKSLGHSEVVSRAKAHAGIK